MQLEEYVYASNVATNCGQLRVMVVHQLLNEARYYGVQPRLCPIGSGINIRLVQFRYIACLNLVVPIEVLFKSGHFQDKSP